MKRNRAAYNDDQRRHTAAERACFLGKGGHPFRPEERQKQDVTAIDRDDDERGIERADIHVAHRPAELVGHDDEDERRRHDLRQRAGSGNRACCDRLVVAVTRHDRQGDKPHGDHGCSDDAGGCGQQCAHENDRIGETAADRTEKLADRVEQVLGHS